MLKSNKIGKKYFKLMTLCSLAIFFFVSCKDDNLISINPPSGYLFIDIQPSWSPDGNKIAYIHSYNNAGLYIIDTSGGNNMMILNDPYINSLDFSPTGIWIVFDSRGHIFKIKTTGDSLTQLTFTGSNFFASWSPDEEWIVYDSNNESPNGMFGIWKMRKDGSGNIRIAYEPNNGEIRMPSWSNNINRIIVQKYILGTGADPEIAVIDTNGNTISVLTDNNNFDNYPRISPDGDKAIFTTQSEKGINFQIYSVNIDGSNLKRLTNTQGYTSDYSPNGEYIAYCDSGPNNGKLWIMKLSGTYKKQLTN